LISADEGVLLFPKNKHHVVLQRRKVGGNTPRDDPSRERENTVQENR
jgi:hypothetical protein